ncbi:hypothetical protein BKA65DRAFT_165449 [Rhexocercosporidium sp. MPI-PUGE-AT-0058]|nr:hypothetical protein BKA65DRAFT_165449 [Rhexocercosporidium sp. MPI-PUGE-AT-0058]
MERLARRLHYPRLWKSPRAKALAACSIHVPSLITTTTLIYFNFSSTWFSSVGTSDQNAQFNALQFAAKVHEIIIIASLSAVAVSFVQRELCRRQGLAFGGVLAAFQITNVLSLFRPSLWRTSLATGRTSYRIQFGLFITILTILSAIVGPSSAILMLPSVGSWDLGVPLTWNQGTIKHASIFLYGNESTIWPSTITTSNFLPPECILANTSTILPDHCASAGLPILLTRPWQGSLASNGYGPIGVMWNFSMSGNVSVKLGYADDPPELYTYNRAVQGVVPQDMDSRILTQSTFSSMNAAMISTYVKAGYSQLWRPKVEWKENVAWRFAFQNRSRTLAPQTFVLCRTEPLLIDSNNTIPAGKVLTFPLRGAENWSMSASSLTDRWNSTAEQVSIWVEPPSLYNNTPSISFASIGRTYQQMQHSNETSPSSNTTITSEIVTCSVYASWHPVDFTLRSGTPFRISSSVLDDVSQRYENWQPESLQQDFSLSYWLNNVTEPGARDINLHTSWANLALPPELTVEKIASTFGLGLPQSRQPSIGAALSFLITDALSRFDSSGEVIIARQDPIGNANYIPMYDISTLNISDLTEISIMRDRYGYSYSTSGTTRRLAIGVMLIHIAVALIHTALVVWRGWWCPGLQSLTEFFVLAVESSPANTSQPDFATEKYKYNIQVREVGDEKLELKIDCRSEILNYSDDNGRGVVKGQIVCSNE